MEPSIVLAANFALQHFAWLMGLLLDFLVSLVSH